MHENGFYAPLSAILRNILEGQKRRGLLEEEICTALLQKDVELESAYFSAEQINSPNRYPKHPLCIQLSEKLSQWIECGEPPHLQLSSFPFLDGSIAQDSRHETAQKVTQLLLSLKQSWDTASEDDISDQMSTVLCCLGKRGLLDLLGVRQTVGSVDLFPPPLGALLKAFNEKHKPELAKLTVGARALSKHCHRDKSDQMWWGVCTGTEQAKNEHSHGILMKLLSDASWINLHVLPHDIKVLEIRSREGYGARWSCDGTEFRGFLEPQMSDGHSVGWQHW